ncbi:jg17848, partial [Pararge aegeria aegeria]
REDLAVASYHPTDKYVPLSHLMFQFDVALKPIRLAHYHLRLHHHYQIWLEFWLATSHRQRAVERYNLHTPHVVTD